MSMRILIADDQKIMRDGLKSLIGKEPTLEVVGEAENGRQVLALAAELKPDVIIMDISMPELNGIDATREILSANKGVKVIALSMYPHKKLVRSMLQAGASGYLLKDCAFRELVLAIKTVAKNRTFLSPGISDILIEDFLSRSNAGGPTDQSLLTPREREVLQLIAEGKTSRQISAIINISDKTVDTHRQSIMKKLDIRTVAGLTKIGPGDYSGKNPFYYPPISGKVPIPPRRRVS
jgi:two-component system response regulator NreC